MLTASIVAPGEARLFLQIIGIATAERAVIVTAESLCRGSAAWSDSSTRSSLFRVNTLKCEWYSPSGTSMPRLSAIFMTWDSDGSSVTRRGE